MKILNFKFQIFAICILTLAAFFRLYAVAWDQDQHMHPDERFLTMVTQAIQWPKNATDYLDASISPLNPHNKGYSFFVYGTFPIFFTRLITDYFHSTNYTDITLIGRRLSALFDLGTVILVFLIAKEISTKSKVQMSKKHSHVIPAKPACRQGRAGIHSFVYGSWITSRMTTKYKTWDLKFGIFPLFSMFLYATMVLPIQLSHFYAVDTYLTFFITLTFFFLTKIMNKNIHNSRFLILNSIMLGISLGLALACKITAVFFAPIIALGLLYWVIKNKDGKTFVVLCLLLLVFCYLTFRFTQPYLFATADILNLSLNPKVLDNWKQLKSFDDATGGFPPAVQWITTKPYIFPLKNMIYWGMGIPLGIISLCAIGYQLSVIGYQIIKKKFNSQPASPAGRLTTYNVQLNLILLWIISLFAYQGSQFIKALRYFYPMYPFIALLSGYFCYEIYLKLQKKLTPKIFRLLVIGYLLLMIIYPLSFMAIYTKPLTRVTASLWIFKNIPFGSTVSSEEWDDGLPVSIAGNTHEVYKKTQFPLYWPETQAKWDKIIPDLQKTDYVILTSNRLYGSIMTFPQKYPITIRYYDALFDGSLGFEKIAEFTSRPNIPIPFMKWCINLPAARYGIVAKPSQQCELPGVSFVDDYADETFTVYDHPKVIIFKKVKNVDYRQVLQIN
jgi:hypothetical protein